MIIILLILFKLLYCLFLIKSSASFYVISIMYSSFFKKMLFVYVNLPSTNNTEFKGAIAS